MKRSILIVSILVALLIVTSNSSSVTAQANACAKAPAPRLKTGTSAQITKASSTDLPLAFLKTDPGRAGPVLRYLPIGTVVDVLDGPRCGDDKGYWWRVKLGDLTGWLAEAPVKNAYALEPATGPAATPLPSTVTTVLTCIAPSTPVAPMPVSTAAVDAGKLLRVVYATLDGNLMVSDNGAVGRQLAAFNPAPLGVDLSPDGTAAAVITYNGLYWVDASTGKVVMLADAPTLGMQEGMYPWQITWLPDNANLALEVVDTRETATSYTLWSVSINGAHPPFRVDTGSQPSGGVYKAPVGNRTVVVSANDISPFPKDTNDPSDPMIEYVPQQAEGDITQLVMPSISWSPDGKGFYTYIPPSAEASPTDSVAGHLWYLAFDGRPKDLGKPAKLKANDYVIPSPDGSAILAGRGTAWVIQDPKTGKVLQSLPATQYLFGWVPDASGVVYTTKTGELKFLGTDGGTDSDFVPAANDVFEIKWLPDNTVLYAIKGKDGKLSFKVKPTGEDDKFLGIITSVSAFGAARIPEKPLNAVVPQACK